MLLNSLDVDDEGGDEDEDDGREDDGEGEEGVAGEEEGRGLWGGALGVRVGHRQRGRHRHRVVALPTVGTLRLLTIL